MSGRTKRGRSTPPAAEPTRRAPSWLRALLPLFPRGHRRLYGEEIWEVAAHRWTRQGAGWRATLAMAWDLGSGAAVLRANQLRDEGMGMGRGWGMDLRFVLRSLWKSRGYVFTAVVVLACAVAANTTIYSYIQGTLLAEPSYPEPESVALVWGRNLEDGQRRDVISGPNTLDLRESLTTARVATFHYDGTYIELDGRPEVFTALDVSADVLDVLGIAPAQGRGFGETERRSGGAPSILVSHGFWRDHLEADPDVVGSALRLEGVPHTILGVMGEGADFLAPAPIVRVLHDDLLEAQDRGNIHYNVVARLRPGASWDQLNAELGRVAREIEAEYSGFEGWDFHAEPIQRITTEAVRSVLWFLGGAVTLVLLVAALNLATLFRVRTAVRREELAIRAALGAGRRGLLRVLLLEPVLLALVGGGIGLAVAPMLLAELAEIVPPWIPIPDSAAAVPVLYAELAPGVAITGLAVAVGASLLLSLPAVLQTVRAGRDTSRTELMSGGSGRVARGVGGVRWLIGAELAVTVVLCMSAGLFVRSLDEMLQTDLGLVPEGLLTVRFGDVWDQPFADQARYFEQVVQSVEAVPGVEEAGVIDYVDFRAEDDFARVYFLDRELQPVNSVREEWRRVDAGLFRTARMPIVQGRDFAPEDLEGPARTAIVNRSFAERHYPGGDAVGQLISTHDSGYVDMRIVGIVEDVWSLGPTTPPPAVLYVPQQGSPRGTVGLYARTSLPPMELAAAVREAIWAVDPTQPVMDIAPMTSLVDRWYAIPWAARSLVVTLAGIAWGLSVIGVFGVASYTVRSRRSELGIRAALGASRARLEGDQLRAIFPVVVIGIGVGIAGALAMGTAVRSLLYGVSPTDPWVLLASIAVTAAAAILAAWLPARRAGRVDPKEILG